MNVREQHYTDSRLKAVCWPVLRAVLRCAAAGSGVCGTSPLLGCTAVRAVDEGFPPVTWWRTGARAGIAAAEAFANSGPRPAPPPGPAAADGGPLAGESAFRSDDRDLAGRTGPGDSLRHDGRDWFR